MPIVTRTELSGYFRRCVDASGVTVEAFAQRFGISRTNMSRALNGHTMPSDDLLAKLGVEHQYSIPETPQVNPKE